MFRKPGCQVPDLLVGTWSSGVFSRLRSLQRLPLPSSRTPRVNFLLIRRFSLLFFSLNYISCVGVAQLFRVFDLLGRSLRLRSRASPPTVRPYRSRKEENRRRRKKKGNNKEKKLRRKTLSLSIRTIPLSHTLCHEKINYRRNHGLKRS